MYIHFTFFKNQDDTVSLGSIESDEKYKLLTYLFRDTIPLNVYDLTLEEIEEVLNGKKGQSDPEAFCDISNFNEITISKDVTLLEFMENSGSITRLEIPTVNYKQLIKDWIQFSKLIKVAFEKNNSSLLVSDFSIYHPNFGGTQIRLDIGKAYFFEKSEEEFYDIFLLSGRGLKWSYRNEEIYIQENGLMIWGLPSPNLQKVIVIYPMDHGIYPAPNNAVIHNADGSVYMQLSPPELISDLAKQQKERDPKGPFMVHFEDVSWQYNNSGEIVICISIAYNRDWHEDRELNTETGEFGECMSSGRR